MGLIKMDDIKYGLAYDNMSIVSGFITKVNKDTYALFDPETTHVHICQKEWVFSSEYELYESIFHNVLSPALNGYNMSLYQLEDYFNTTISPYVATRDYPKLFKTIPYRLLRECVFEISKNYPEFIL